MANPLRRAARRALPAQSNGIIPSGLKDVRPGQLLSRNELDTPLWSDWSTEAAIKEGYKSSVYVYSAISRIAKAASSVPWKVFSVKNDGSKDEVPDHPLSELLTNPNPFISGGDMFERLIAHLYLGGNGLLSKVRPTKSQPPGELWPLPPDGMHPVPSKDGLIDRYEYKKGEIEHVFRPEDVVHVMFVDPSNIYWGMGPLMAAAKTVDTDVEAVNWNKVALQNRAITDGVISFKEALTREQWEGVRDQVREQHMGADNARTPWVLGSDASWNQMSLSPAEMDFIESRKMTREEIAAVFHVPPPMLGIFDNATLANYETSRTVFWKDTTIPLLDDLRSALSLSMREEFLGEGEELDYDVSGVDALRDNYGAKVDQASKLFAMGFPPNAIASSLELDLPEIEGGDVGFIASGLKPLAQAADPAAQEALVPGAEPNNALPAPEPEEDAPDTGDDVVEAEVVDEPAGAIEGASTNGHDRKLDTVLEYSTSDIRRYLDWKTFDDQRKPYEEALARRAKSLLQEEAGKLASAHAAGKSYESAVKGREDVWMALLVATHQKLIEDFGKRSYRELGGKSGAKAFEIRTPSAQRWIKKKARASARSIIATTIKSAQDAQRMGEEAGEGVTAFIRTALKAIAGKRSEVIAGTEVVAGSNYGNREGAIQLPKRTKREWITRRDNKVRDAHDRIDGQRRGADEPYDVAGHKAMFPGDPELPIELAINCRCREKYFVSSS